MYNSPSSLNQQNGANQSRTASGPRDFIPGINVGNIFRQAGSYVGLAPKADYDILGGVTLSSRPGQAGVPLANTPISQNRQTVPARSDGPQPTGNGGQGDVTTYDAYGNPTGGGGVSAWTPGDQTNYQIGVDQVNSALGRLPGQFDVARGNINNQYNQANQSAVQALGNAKTQFNDGQTTNQQNYRTGQNDVNQMARGDHQSLLRRLSSMGAGGGSEAQYLIPELVGQQAAKGLAGAASNFAGNEQNLNTVYNSYEQDNKRHQDSLVNQRDQQLNQAQSQSDTNKSSLLQQLMGLNSSRAQSMGSNVRTAVDPYLSQINTLAESVNNLGRFNPKYTGEVAAYKAPSLDSFAPAQSGLNQSQAIQNAQGATTPYLEMLMGLKDKRETAPSIYNPNERQDNLF